MFVPATPDDVDRLLVLMEEFYALERIRFEPRTARSALCLLLGTSSAGQAFLIRARDEALAGYLVLTFGFSLEFRGRFALLDELYVRGTFRRQGLGRAALLVAEDICRRQGIAALRLEVDRGNQAGQALYRAAGFEDHRRDFLTKWVANPRAAESNSVYPSRNPGLSSQSGDDMAKKKKSARKPNAAFMKPVTPSAALAVVVGSKPIPRTEVTKKLWAYIKKNSLQDKKNKRMIKADAALKPVFGGKAQVNMFEMTKLVSKHLK